MPPPDGGDGAGAGGLLDAGGDRWSAPNPIPIPPPDAGGDGAGAGGGGGGGLLAGGSGTRDSVLTAVLVLASASFISQGAGVGGRSLNPPPSFVAEFSVLAVELAVVAGALGGSQGAGVAGAPAGVDDEVAGALGGSQGAGVAGAPAVVDDV